MIEKEQARESDKERTSKRDRTHVYDIAITKGEERERKKETSPPHTPYTQKQ